MHLLTFRMSCVDRKCFLDKDFVKFLPVHSIPTLSRTCMFYKCAIKYNLPCNILQVEIPLLVFQATPSSALFGCSKCGNSAGLNCQLAVGVNFKSKGLYQFELQLISVAGNIIANSTQSYQLSFQKSFPYLLMKHLNNNNYI